LSQTLWYVKRQAPGTRAVDSDVVVLKWKCRILSRCGPFPAARGSFAALGSRKDAMHDFTKYPRRIGALLASALVGCDAAPRPETSDTSAADVPAARLNEVLPVQTGTRDGHRPDLSQLSYDASMRKLRVYALSERGARWLLMLPGFPMGVPIDGEYDFPAAMECDLDQVQLVITAPNRRPSTPVTLRDILDMGSTAKR